MIKTIKKAGYNLHIINTKKFKTISIKMIFWDKLRKEELSLRNLLADILLFSCKKYDDNRKMNIVKEELYNTDLGCSIYRSGTQIITEITLSCISDKYTEDGNLKNSLDFLFECINNPNVKSNSFDLKSFNIVREKQKSAIKNEENNPNIYAYRRYKSLTGNDEILSSSILGTIDDLDKITPVSLYEYYKTFFTNNHIDIYVLGDTDNSFIEEYFDKNFCFKSNALEYTRIDTSYEKDYSNEVEPSKYNQSKLIMGSSIKNLTEHEKKYEAIIYNIILGNSPTSKLFQNVREKKSYAYTISSSINRLDGMLVITAGISYKNYEDTVKEVKKQIELMKEGKFTEKEIKHAKEVVLSILKEIDDSAWSMINHYNNYLYYRAETLEKQKEEIRKITKDDIIKVANKINIDTVYLLKEDLNEEI